MPDDQAPVRWEPDRKEVDLSPWAGVPMLTAIGRGAANHCPTCGQDHVFRGYLKVKRECAECGTPLGLVRAEDAPPYFTIVAVGHIIIPLMLLLETSYKPPLWVHAAIWLPLTVILSLALLRPIKGGTVGLMLKLNLLRTEAE